MICFEKIKKKIFEACYACDVIRKNVFSMRINVSQREWKFDAQHIKRWFAVWNVLARFLPRILQIVKCILRIVGAIINSKLTAYSASGSFRWQVSARAYGTFSLWVSYGYPAFVTTSRYRQGCLWFLSSGFELPFRTPLQPFSEFWLRATPSIRALWMCYRLTTPRIVGSLHASPLAYWSVSSSPPLTKHHESAAPHQIPVFVSFIP